MASVSWRTPTGEELAILISRWGFESPWYKVAAQLFQISPVVMENILVEGNAVASATMQAFKKYRSKMPTKTIA